MKRKYEYLVKYNYNGGVGTFKCIIAGPITSFNDINKIKEYIEKEYGLKNVGIESYILVSKRECKRKFIK